MTIQDWLEDDEIVFKKQWIKEYITEINELKNKINHLEQENQDLKKRYNKIKNKVHTELGEKTENEREIILVVSIQRIDVWF